MGITPGQGGLLGANSSSVAGGPQFPWPGLARQFGEVVREFDNFVIWRKPGPSGAGPRGRPVETLESPPAIDYSGPAFGTAGCAGFLFRPHEQVIHE
jgi:hypothetical protein